MISFYIQFCQKLQKWEQTKTRFHQDFLKVHNEYRKKHGAPSLALSKKVIGSLPIFFPIKENMQYTLRICFFLSAFNFPTPIRCVNIHKSGQRL